MISQLTSLKSDSSEDVQLPTHLTVRTKFSPGDLGLSELVRLFARVQATFSFIGIIIFCSFAVQEGRPTCKFGTMPSTIYILHIL